MCMSLPLFAIYLLRSTLSYHTTSPYQGMFIFFELLTRYTLLSTIKPHH